MKRLLFGVCALIGVLALPAAAFAQSSTTGAIAGVARDTTGAVLPGVTVEAASPALIEKVRTAVTDDQGNYKIIDLRPGAYAVTFTLPGFSTFRREGLELNTGVTVPVNAEMRVGGLEESVTVTGASPVVDVQNTRSQNILRQEVLEALPASRTNAGFAELTLGAASLSGGAAVVDQGGSKGDSSQRLTVHGMRPFDQRIYYDGMYHMNLFVSGKNWQTNQMGVQEVVIGTSSGSGEVETSGMQINYIPKEGGNRFRGTINSVGTNGNLQADNISDEILATGVTSGQKVKRVYDVGVGVGGPIAQDKLWFYAAGRWWGSQEYQPGAFYNASTNPLRYVPDTSRRAYADLNAKDYGVRLTWQAAAKHKVNFDYHLQDSCQCYLTLNALISPESAPWVHTWPSHQFIGSWNNAVSNQLLIEAGLSYYHLTYDLTHDTPFTNAVRVSEQIGVAGGASAGMTYGGPGVGINSFRGNSQQPNINQRASLSYVVGSHAFKVGNLWMDGFFDYYQETNKSMEFTLRGGSPVSLVQWALPGAWHQRLRNIGIYAQDQWTIKRLTVNGGVRYDHYRGWVPAGQRQASAFTPAFSFDKVDNVPNLKDINPRVGAAFDVFGNGKTAIKGAIGRYVGALGVEFQDANNPARTIVENVTRTWTDTNGNFVPDCTLTVFTQNGECGQVSNLAFGTVVRNTFFDPSVTEGWSARTYSWQSNVTLQQELLPGVGLNVTYFRTQYGNFGVSPGLASFARNTLVTASDFDPYCVTTPADSRLPGGGNQRLCGLFNVSRARVGQVQNLVTAQDQFGVQKEYYDGVDVALSARFGRGGVLNGGVSLGRQQSNTCFQNTRPDLTAQGFAAASPRNDDYCTITPPWSAGTQVKANGFYPLPWFGLQPSFTFQSLPGASISANRAFTNAEIAPSLGRSLSACPTVGTCTATVTVNMIEPQTRFLDRVNTLNLGIAKTFQIGTWRAKGQMDVYNVFNVSTVLNVSGTYGTTWLRPTSIIGGRLVRFSAQVDF